jgi:GxxExxY protein
MQGQKRKLDATDEVENKKQRVRTECYDVIIQMILECIIDISNEIYEILGCGHTESIYHRALETELRLHGVNYNSEVATPINYKGSYIGYGRADVVIPDILVIELKATATSLRGPDKEKLRAYMTSLNIDDGIIINFPQSESQTKCQIDFL